MKPTKVEKVIIVEQRSDHEILVLLEAQMLAQIGRASCRERV